MAYIKIFPIKATVDKAVDYITNPDKTEEQLLVSSFGCSPETAELEFAMTHDAARMQVQDRDSNLARHLIISFKPGEITDPQMAHEIGTKIADAVLKGKYEYVLSTHVDKDHYHCHIIFNDVSFVDHHRYRSNKRTYHKICQISNKVCREYGLTESMPTGQKSMSYKENMEYKNGTSWKAKLKYAVDRAIWSSVTYDEFLMKMKESGYEIRQGKHLAFRAPEQKHFTNVKTLGSYYTEDKILARLEQNRHKTKLPKNISREVRVFVQMTSYVAENNYPGYEQYIKRNNLKEAAKTFNYLSEHNLLNYEEFQNHISDLNASVEAAEDQILQLEKAIGKHQHLQRRCENYRVCRDVIRGEKDTPDKAAYRKQHVKEYQLHDSILKELSDLGIHKLPSPEKLQKQLDQLQQELAAAKKEKQDLQKQHKTLGIIESNYEAMLRGAGIDVPEKQPESKTRDAVIS